MCVCVCVCAGGGADGGAGGECGGCAGPHSDGEQVQVHYPLLEITYVCVSAL